ncbi:MAG: DUF4340 domain-containing protein [Brevinematales bacterium]|nr:DUF4340 domain-containing protein [Brevinematales bacterium]
MRGKALLILSLSAILLGLVVFFLIIDRGEVKVIKKRDYLVGKFSSDDISYLGIYFRDYYDRTKEYEYFIIKSNNLWFVSYSNIIDRVEYKLANFVANIIGDIENLGSISSNEVEDIINSFGFSRPNARITFVANNITNEILVGNLAPTKDYYYVTLNGNYETIYLVYAYKIDNILKYPEEIRDKNIFTHEWTNITGIEYKPISFPKIIFTNKNNKWFSVIPIEKEVDSIFIENEFLKNLRSLAIEHFIDQDNKLYKNLILKTNTPISQIKLYNGYNEMTLMVLDKIKTNFYCYDTIRKVIFAIDYESSKSLFDAQYERFVKITN